MQKILRYGILGGTFDPPHLGHLTLAQEAFAQLGLDRVWFVPAADPPHKPSRKISPAAQRVEMTRLAVAEDARFAVSDIEVSLPKPSFTVRTLAALRRQWPEGAQLTLILGWDMLLNLPQWYEPDQVVSAVDCIAAEHRPGYAEDGLRGVETAVQGVHDKLVVLSGPLLDLSGTDLRDRVASGLPIRYLVPDRVRAYVEAHGLYLLDA